MKVLKLVLCSLLSFVLLFSVSCNKVYTYEEAYNKIRVGMSEEKIIKLMGEPTFEESLGFNDGISEYFKVVWWLNGATSKEDADQKFENKIPVTYYAVILQSKDNYSNWKFKKAMAVDEEGNYYVDKNQSNKMTGIWNVSI